MTKRSGAAFWLVTLGAAAVMMITIGSRQTLGLFLSPLALSTGLGVARVSFVLAIGQLVWGLSQPLYGAFADRYGPARVIALGTILLALGTALTPFVQTGSQLMLTLGIMAAAGAGAGSFSILIALAAKRLPADRQSYSAGIINAGGSFGQFVFAPLVQAIISSAGWVSAMLATASLSLLVLPLAFVLRAPAASGKTSPVAAVSPLGLGAQLRVAARDPSYLLLNAGFFTCGFHIAFLVTHLPGEVALCGQSASIAATSLGLIGLFNIAGSLSAGALGRWFRLKTLLVWMYGSRAAIIALYLLAPKTALTFYVFAAGLGFTWLSTVPPTAGLVAKLYGTRYMATLFGLTLVSHQVGGFFGAWLGGEALVRFGDYNWMWYADIALASAAALANLPIREPRLQWAAA